MEDGLPVSSWDTTITEPARKIGPPPPGSFYDDDDLKGMVFRVENMSYYVDDINEVQIVNYRKLI